jgi:hypothetical protein
MILFLISLRFFVVFASAKAFLYAKTTKVSTAKLTLGKDGGGGRREVRVRGEQLEKQKIFYRRGRKGAQKSIIIVMAGLVPAIHAVT